MRSSYPKVAHTVAGLPLIAHVLRAASEIDPSSVFVVVSPLHREDFFATLGNQVSLVDQPIPLGTGDALAKALDAVPTSDTHILVLNGDVPLLRGETIQELVSLHLNQSATLSLLTASVPAHEAKYYGRLQRGVQGNPISILESSDVGFDDSTSIEINVGAYAMDPHWLREAISMLKPRPSGEYYLTDLVTQAIDAGCRVEALNIANPNEGFGVNTKIELARAEKIMQDRLREYWMSEGVTMVDPTTTYLHYGVRIGSDVVIHPNTCLHGTTAVGDECSIGPNAFLVDSTIGRKSIIGSSILHGATLWDDVHVGPYCHLRTGTELRDGVTIGSHVEIKGSVIGGRTKIGHFSYIGDASVGTQVNIGAGTVTCNFDGKKKNLTEIGDGALIGSDTMLVAPVRLGDGVVTGAGAVVTHDIMDHETVVGAPARPLMGRHSRPETSSEMEEEETLG
jgi:bifunctional UDP-N-acetylglucosamine pyrophosphorylase/glucosamine-1-phosphate N-acetyltransferase